jgi:hypothetical protein
MKCSLSLLLVVTLSMAGCSRLRSLSPESRYEEAQRRLASANGEEARFYALDGAAKSALDIGKPKEADAYAREALTLADKFQSDWNYGNAVHDGHVVLGRLALLNGDRSSACQHLLEAGDTRGSPQLNSFGPNMTLARDLLNARERDCVLQYFQKCRGFWKMGQDKLSEWEDAVRQQRVPAFGANLLY